MVSRTTGYRVWRGSWKMPARNTGFVWPSIGIWPASTDKATWHWPCRCRVLAVALASVRSFVERRASESPKDLFSRVAFAHVAVLQLHVCRRSSLRCDQRNPSGVRLQSWRSHAGCRMLGNMCLAAQMPCFLSRLALLRPPACCNRFASRTRCRCGVARQSLES